MVAKMIKYDRYDFRKHLNPNTKGLHLVGFGASGIDLRYLLHHDDELARLAKSVLTINSPHKYTTFMNRGSVVSEFYIKGFQIPSIDQVANSYGIDS